MKYFLKNISASAIRVRSLGEKISVEAGEIFEVTGEEFENHTTLYPKFFEQTFEEKEEKIDDEASENPDDNSDEKDDEASEKTTTKKIKTKNTDEK